MIRPIVLMSLVGLFVGAGQGAAPPKPWPTSLMALAGPGAVTAWRPLDPEIARKLAHELRQELHGKTQLVTRQNEVLHFGPGGTRSSEPLGPPSYGYQTTPIGVTAALIRQRNWASALVVEYTKELAKFDHTKIDYTAKPGATWTDPSSKTKDKDGLIKKGMTYLLFPSKESRDKAKADIEAALDNAAKAKVEAAAAIIERKEWLTRRIAELDLAARRK